MKAIVHENDRQQKEPGHQHADAIEGERPQVIHTHPLRDKGRAPDGGTQKQQKTTPKRFIFHFFS